MKVTEIAFSGYTITDIERSRKFYEGVLGLKAASVYEADGMAFIEYWIGTDEDVLVIGKGAPHMAAGPNGGATVALEVDDFEEAVKTIKKNKVEVVMPATDGGPCNMMLIKDPDGNLIMIHKRKKA